MQKYTGIALGAGSLPIAMATGVAASPTLGRVATTAWNMANDLSRNAAAKVLSTAGGEKIAKNVYDFATAFNSGELPAQSVPAAVGTAIANSDGLGETVSKMNTYTNSKIGKKKNDRK